MRVTTFILTCTLAVATAVGTAAAQPADEGDGVAFTARAVDGASVIDIDSGTMSSDNDVFQIKAADGTLVAAMPLRLRLDDFEFPIAAAIYGHSTTLVPQVDIARAAYRPVALPFEDQAPFRSEYEREVAAWNRMSSTIAMGAIVGTVVGGLGGAAVGCVLGGTVGAAAATATIIGLFGPILPAAAVGCLGGVIAVGALGTIAGQLLVTAPVIVAAAIQYFTTINSPLPH
ncbi:hypothetical protein [Nocardia pseudovaccinii]|uniref:hypothetical protein n=1 Tax=Nocardia pseudovaccinii TaxID=189540 RepID=UPI0007A3B2D9|nr:hypothetical protein [Nocardia pseudovaccinii]